MVSINLLNSHTEKDCTSSKKCEGPCQLKIFTEEQILQKLKNSREQANKGLGRDADIVIADLRKKYGLKA